ncbi:MAG: VOC family protein [Candidatus Brocadiae bacterium]|nr:VOC family protein [Candidatus Brocadiia bacterium]
MPKIVQHVAVNCKDKAAQEQFYTKHFGFRRARVFNPGRPDEFVMLRLGDTCMELFQADAGPDASGGEQEVGFKHFCFQVPDVARKVAELNADGMQTGPVIDCSDQVPGLKVCFFNDPEGNVLELMEGWQDEADPPPAA